MTVTSLRRMDDMADDPSVENELDLIRLGHRLEGQEPDQASMDRARRILTGELSIEEARAQVRAECLALSEGLPTDDLDDDPGGYEVSDPADRS